MRPLRYIIVLLVLSTSCAWAGTWTFIQGKRSTACTTSSATCSTTLVAGVGGGTGNVIVVIAGTAANATETISSATIGADNFTLVAASGCHSHAASTAATTDCAYIINPTAGGTVVSVTLSAIPSVAWNIAVIELQDSAAAAFDTAGHHEEPSATTAPVGATLSLAGGDAIVQSIRSNGATPSAIDTGYTNALTTFTSTINAAYLLNTSVGTAPTWTQSSFKASLNGIAFKDSGVVSVVRHRAQVISQ